MTDRAVSIVADTLRTHLLTPFGRCACGAGDGIWEIDDEAPWSDHVAAAVVDALGGLERERDLLLKPTYDGIGDGLTVNWDGRAAVASCHICEMSMEPTSALEAYDLGLEHMETAHGVKASFQSRWVSGWVREPAGETP